MATAGGLEIHTEIAHKPAGPARETLEAAPVAPAPPRAEVVPLERPRQQSKLTAVPAIALAVVALLVAGIASALVRGNEKPASPLAMVQAAASKTTDVGTARVSATVKSDSGIL